MPKHLTVVSWQVRCFADERQLSHAPLRELHNGDWVAFAEVPERFTVVRDAVPCEPASDFGMDPILAVHDRAYIDFLRSAHGDWLAAGRRGDAIGYTFPIRRRRHLSLERVDARLGAYSYDAATPIAAGTWESAYWSAQSALTAATAFQDGASNAFALCRPPGHHAGHDYMGGYCYLNHVAIAARQAAKLGLGPVAILDVDYHHGNGTQDIFYDDPAVFFASIHADPATDYPFYWGHADERGAGEAVGTTLNLPLARGADWLTYRPALSKALEAITRFGARTLLVSFGADTFARDPISHFRLETVDYKAMGAAIAELGLPTAIILEGGYAVTDLGANVAAILSGLARVTASD
jgi:acetoin utilization deacetylase AcuC-like enzyme